MDLEDRAGNWTGYWLQRGRRGTMELVLIPANRRLEGEGVDAIGTFRILGTYSVAGYAVQFIKSYRTHEILYEGVWNGQRLCGTWIVQGAVRSFWADWLGHTGSFEIWPLAEP